MLLVAEGNPGRPFTSVHAYTASMYRILRKEATAATISDWPAYQPLGIDQPASFFASPTSPGLKVTGSENWWGSINVGISFLLPLLRPPLSIF